LTSNEVLAICHKESVMSLKCRLVRSALTASFLMVSGSSVFANLQLAQVKGCMVCHAMQVKVDGPSFKDIAARYRGKKGVEALLVSRILKGGPGVWGSKAMPSSSQVNQAEARVLVNWILTVK
jgi:cytochrome c